MKRKPPPERDDGPALDGAPQRPIPALPAWKAFVVQFSRETDSRSDTFSGRVEHLSSGTRAHFNSGAELLATLNRLLEDLDSLAK